MPKLDWEPKEITSANDYDQLPRHLVENLHRYVREGRSLGHFLTAILENDLGKAVQHADGTNQKLLAVWARYVFNRIPADCHGSKEKVQAWIEKRQSP